MNKQMTKILRTKLIVRDRIMLVHIIHIKRKLIRETADDHGKLIVL